MRIDVVNEKYNPFMKRKEIEIDIETPEEPTPSKAQITELISKHSGKEADYIEIMKISSLRGVQKAKATVLVWDEKVIKKEKKKDDKKKE